MSEDNQTKKGDATSSSVSLAGSVLQDSDFLQLYSGEIHKKNSALEAAKQSMMKRDARISELETLINQGETISNQGENSTLIKKGFSEFMRQVNRAYAKSIWDGQKKDEFGFTTVAEMDKSKPFKIFYEEFNAQADEGQSKVTPEMVEALTPHIAVLDKIYGSRTHQFGHLFHSEQARRNLKRLTNANFVEIREDAEKYNSFKNSFPKSIRDIIDRIDVKVAVEAVEDTRYQEQVKELEGQIGDLKKELKENNKSKSDIQYDSLPSLISEEVVDGIYERFDIIQKTLENIENYNKEGAQKYLDTFKELIDLNAKIVEMQSGINEENKDVEDVSAKKKISPDNTYTYNPDNTYVPPTSDEETNSAKNTQSSSDQNLDDVVGEEPSNPDAPEGEYSNLDELYAKVKQDRDEGDYDGAMKNLTVLFKSGYQTDKVFCEAATINLLHGGDDNIEGAKKLFGLLISDSKEFEVSEEVKLVAYHNLGYILEMQGNEIEAGNFTALNPEDDSRINIVYSENLAGSDLLEYSYTT